MELVAQCSEARAQARHCNRVVGHVHPARRGRLVEHRGGALRDGGVRECEPVRAEAGDRHEGIARAHRATVLHEPGHHDIGRHAIDVRQQFRQRHRARHGATSRRSATSTDGATCATPGVSACAFACAASQVSMSSGGTSISRNVPAMTSLNTGAATAPPP